MRMLLEAVALIALLIMIAIVASRWRELPATVPTHFNAAGKPDRTGPKERALIVPILAVGSYILLTALSRSNLRFNVPFRVDQRSPYVRGQLREMLAAVKALVSMMTAYLSWSIVRVALGQGEGIGRAFVPFISVATFGVVFFYLGRIHRLRQ